MSAVPLLSILMTKSLQTSEYFQVADQNLYGTVGFSNVETPPFRTSAHSDGYWASIQHLRQASDVSLKTKDGPSYRAAQSSKLIAHSAP